MRFKILGCGSNSHGQLANNTQEDSFTLTPALFSPEGNNNNNNQIDPSSLNQPFDSLTDEEPKEIKIGGGHTILLTNRGRVFVAGWNNEAQLGNPSHSDSLIFSSLLCAPDIVSVAAGWSHSILISKSGQTFSFGSNTFGQCGHPTKDQKQILKPQPIEHFSEELSDKPISASCGLKHTLILTSSGTVYAFGHSKFGALGLGKRTSLFEEKPTKILSLNKIVSISAGWKHSLCATNQEVFSFGTCKYGSLGLGESISQTFEPRICFRRSFIRSVFCGSTSSLIATHDFNIFTFGRNQLCQLGNNSKQNKNVPTQIELNTKEPLKDIVYGNEHGLLLTEKGNIYGFGWNEHQNLGTESKENVTSPTLLPQFQKYSNIQLISTGSASSFIVTCE